MTERHDSAPKHGPKHGPEHKHRGPKERELAVALTVAILGAAPQGASLAEVEREALGIYRRAFATVSATDA